MDATYHELVALHFRNASREYRKRMGFKCGNFHMGEEIIQDAYVKALEKPLFGVVDLEEFNYWFYVLTHNAMVDYFRKADVRKKADLHSFQADLVKVFSVEDSSIRELIIQREVSEPRQMGSVKEQVVYDRFVLQMAFKDIAERYGLGLSTVTMMSSRFQKDLESKYDKDMHRGFGS